MGGEKEIKGGGDKNGWTGWTGRGARRRVGGMEGLLARRSQEYEAGRFSNIIGSDTAFAEPSCFVFLGGVRPIEKEVWPARKTNSWCELVFRAGHTSFSILLIAWPCLRTS